MDVEILKYYSRKDVQKKILESAKDREIGVKYGKDGGFGKRPDVLQFENDILELVKGGATSFHVSEERWKNPLLIETGMSKSQLDNIRKGWDLCLPSFEKILINKDKEIKLVTFEELADLLNVNSIGRFKVNKKIKIYSIDSSSMKIKQDKIKEFIVRKKKSEEKLIRITINNGKLIHVSDDHPLLIFTSEGIKIKKAKNIYKEDYLITPLKLDLERKKNTINLIDLIIKHKIKKEYKIKYKNTNVSKFIVYTKKLDKYISSAIRNNISRGGIPFNFYLELDEDLDYKKNAYLGYRKSKVKIPSSIKLTKKFGKLIGYYLSEGCPDKNRLEFIFNISEIKEAKEVIDLTNKIFKTNYKYNIIHKHKKDKSLKVRFSDTLLPIIYKDILGFGHLSTCKKIPYWVYSAPTGFVGGILSGYFTGDGHPRLESNNYGISISSLTASRDLMNGLIFLFLKMGIHHNISRHGERKNVIRISGEEGIERFNRCCGISFIDKKNIKFTRKKINHPSIHNIYPPFLDKTKIKLLKNRIIQSNLYRAIRLKSGLNKKLAKLAANEYLSKILKSDLFPIKIKKIEVFEYRGLFYDIETEKYHNFLHGDGIFTHNCLDVDTKFLEYSKLTTELLVEALKFHDIKNIGVKFSGGSGFHIGIPFESFPPSVDGKETKDLFPEGVRVIAEYLKNMIKDPLRERILNLSKIEDIAKAVDKKKEELFEKNIFNPFSVVGIDSVLIASRHLYRASYSLNEKKGLVSIPIYPNNIKNFNLNIAKIENVKTDRDFLPKKVEGYEAGQLIMQAFDALKKKRFILPEGEIKTKREFETPQMAVKAEHWPPCIQMGLKGMGDGKKRFLFILLNFLKSLSWDMDSIEKIVKEWNQKNREPLKEGYIISQLNWHRQHKEKILPPNCANPAYYADLGIKCPEEICSKCKNPVNFSLRKLRMLKQQKKPRRKTRISNK